MNPSLPPELAAVLDGMLEGVSRRDLATRANAMSAAYRDGRTSQGIVTEADAIAYAVARMPATYAASAAVFARLSQAVPNFAPASLLDVGAGPGSAAWAAAAAWPGLREVTMLDHNPALRALARRFADAGPPMGCEILAGGLDNDLPPADLVVASYVLAEVPEARAAAVAVHLWQTTGTALVLIEPGTPAGFARIRSARAALIEAGAQVAAPCTHGNRCPMQAPDWCHFSQRLPRSRDHMQLKGASVPFEDERYAYVAVMRAPVLHTQSRILAPPLEEKPGITLKLCDAQGLHARFVARREKEDYRRARKSGWGDLF